MPEQHERYESRRKPKACPRCGHLPVAVIRWGDPADTDEDRQPLIDAKKIVMGGGHIPDDPPAWFCYGCDCVIHRGVNI